MSVLCCACGGQGLLELPSAVGVKLLTLRKNINKVFVSLFGSRKPQKRRLFHVKIFLLE